MNVSYKKNKKIISIILCFAVVLSFVVFVPSQQAQAIAVAIPVVALGLVAGLGIAAGIEYTTNDGLRGWCQEFWSNASSSVRDLITQKATAGEKTIAVGADLWDLLRSTRDKLVKGEVSELEYAGDGLVNLFEFTAVDATTAMGNWAALGDYIGSYQFILTTHYYCGQSKIRGCLPGDSQSREFLKFYNNATVVDGKTMYYNQLLVYINSSWTLLTQAESRTNNIPLVCDVVCDGISTSISCNGQSITLTGGSALNLNGLADSYGYDFVVSSNQTGTYTVPVEGNITYNQSISNDETYSLAGNTVTIPDDFITDITSAVGAASGDIVYGLQEPLTGIDNVLGTVTGWLQNIWAKVAAIPASIAGAASRVGVAVRDAVFDTPADFSLDFSGFKNLIIVEKFPFCIPWDMINSVKTFAAAASDFSFGINLDTEYFQINHDVDLSKFVVPFAFFRYAASVFFAMFLIAKTRDLIKW